MLRHGELLNVGMCVCLRLEELQAADAGFAFALKSLYEPLEHLFVALAAGRLVLVEPVARLHGLRCNPSQFQDSPHLDAQTSVPGKATHGIARTFDHA